MAKKSISDETLTLNELFARWPQTVAVFLKHDMLCVGCLVAPFHTINDACTEYHLDEAHFRRALVAALT